MPSRVLIAHEGEKISYPVTARRYTGKPPKKDAKLNGALQYLSIGEYSYEPPSIFARA